MTLAELAVGATAAVREITGHDEIAGRLLEMGLVPGTKLTIVGTAPLGDPLELEIRGYRLSIRRSEAARVAIHPA